jgi:GTP cyclohydrolase II
MRVWYAMEVTMPDGTRPTARYAQTLLPTVHGDINCIVYRCGGVEHLALVVGDVGGDDVLCRMHSECLTSEVLGSLKCDCKAQLDAALAGVVARGRGVVLYLRQEGRGIGLGDKIRAYALQETGVDTVDANRMLGLPDDARDYGAAAAMLRDLGVQSVELMTNNPDKVQALAAYGLTVRRVAHVVAMDKRAKDYVNVKVKRMGHLK